MIVQVGFSVVHVAARARLCESRCWWLDSAGSRPPVLSLLCNAHFFFAVGCAWPMREDSMHTRWRGTERERDEVRTKAIPLYFIAVDCFVGQFGGRFAPLRGRAGVVVFAVCCRQRV